MLLHRQELHMRESQAAHVFRQLGGDLAVAQHAIVFAAQPRTEMHLVHDHRLAQRIAFGTL